MMAEMEKEENKVVGKVEKVESEEEFWHSSSCCNNLRYICETTGDQPRGFVR